MHQNQILERLLVAGVAFLTGLGVGFLLAPEAGRTTRRALADGVRSGAHWVEGHTIAPVAEQVRETSQAVAGRVVPQLGDWDVIDGDELVRDLPGLPHRQ